MVAKQTLPLSAKTTNFGKILTLNLPKGNKTWLIFQYRHLQRGSEYRNERYVIGALWEKLTVHILSGIVGIYQINYGNSSK